MSSLTSSSSIIDLARGFCESWPIHTARNAATISTHMCRRYGVTVGAILGHSICTGVAVVGGALLARRISQRTVAVAGGTLFLIFAALNLISRD